MKVTYPTEHEEQVALFEWASYNIQKYPMLANMFAIPNGGLRNIRTAINLKKEGVKAGVLDIFFAYPSKGFGGFFIEMKRKGNKPSDEQIDWIERLTASGFKCSVCYNWNEAKNVIIEYIE